MLWILFMAGGGRKLSLFLFGSPLSQVPWRRLQKAPVLASISFLCVGLSTARANRHCFLKGPLSLSSDDQRAVQEFGTCWQVSSENPSVDWNRAEHCQAPTGLFLYCITEVLVRPFLPIFQKSRLELNIEVQFPTSGRECGPLGHKPTLFVWLLLRAASMSHVDLNMTACDYQEMSQGCYWSLSHILQKKSQAPEIPPAC